MKIVNKIVANFSFKFFKCTVLSIYGLIFLVPTISNYYCQNFSITFSFVLYKIHIMNYDLLKFTLFTLHSNLTCLIFGRTRFFNVFMTFSLVYVILFIRGGGSLLNQSFIFLHKNFSLNLPPFSPFPLAREYFARLRYSH